MATYKSKNYSFQSPVCNNNDIFEKCNISQLQPNTVICSGKTGLTFRDCNLVNCSVPGDILPDMSVVPGDATVEHCNTTQVSRCKYLHPEWEDLPDEVENCSHVVNIDIIEGENSQNITIYERKDTVT